MLILLYGQDTYRLQEKLKEIIVQYKKSQKSGLNLIWLDCQPSLRSEEADAFENFSRAIQQISMFGERKMIILLDVFANQEFEKRFLKNTEHFIDTKEIIIFCQKGELSGKNKLFNLLKARSKVQNFQPLAGEKLKAWLNRKSIESGTVINPQALQKLIDFVGNDSWRLSNEIKKLAAFGKNISEEDVELLVKPVVESAIFKTIDAIAQKNKKQALLFLRQHLEEGDSPAYLISMINFQFRNLLMVKDLIEKDKPLYAIPKITGLHPFVVKKTCQQAVRFSLPELKKIYLKIFQADLDIKTGKLNPEVALDLLVAGN